MIKKHIHIAVEIPTSDVTNKLVIEPGSNGFIVLSDGQFKVGVNAELLMDAIYELKSMRIRHSLPDDEPVSPAPAIGEIIEGDDTDIPF